MRVQGLALRVSAHTHSRQIPQHQPHERQRRTHTSIPTRATPASDHRTARNPRARPHLARKSAKPAPCAPGELSSAAFSPSSAALPSPATPGAGAHVFHIPPWHGSPPAGAVFGIIGPNQPCPQLYDAESENAVRPAEVLDLRAQRAITCPAQTLPSRAAPLNLPQTLIGINIFLIFLKVMSGHF